MKPSFSDPDHADNLLVRALGSSLQQATMRLVIGAALGVAIISLVVWLI